MSEPHQKRRYFDNAATSFPKPPGVWEGMQYYAAELGASPGRGAYREVIEAGRLMDQCRDLLCQLFNGESAEHVIFTLNATDAINLAIRGLATHYRRAGEPMHVVTTWLEHNSVLRPLNDLNTDGVEHTCVQCDPATGLVDPDDIRKAIRPDTRLIATLHGSNVSGTLQPIQEIGAIAREAGIHLLVDAAQTLGHVPIDVQVMNIDLLAFPGHKGLLGPLGTGGLYLRPGMEQLISTVREGGTGSVSERDTQPDFLPDKYEPGSHNALGIIGLAEGLRWILERGVDQLWEHERNLVEIMLEGLGELPGFRVLGPQTVENRCGVFSIVADGFAPAEMAALLEDQFGVLTRPGLHCAPRAHRTFGTHETGGSTRLSLGPFLTEDDVRYAARAVADITSATVEAAGA